ncbi:MAG TPA: response regulator transcription factor [Actinomycetota bacterium]|jgi:DNA-binding NarL/FixJ family response regulator|nr:response regulator transcription factor [Actinomycetota bacterium]
MVSHGEPQPVRVLVVDQHPLIRGVVRIACEAGDRLQVAGEAAGAVEAVSVCASTKPDVVVIDVELPEGGGVEAIRRMRAGGFRGKVIVLTEVTTGEAVLECLRLGVSGYLEKAAGLRTIGSSILRVSLGERLIDPALEQAAVMQLGKFARVAREGSEVAATLTPRELEILRYISEGLTMASIGRRLGISPRTVESHVGKLYRKLAVRTRVQAVSRAVSLGLIDLRA